MISEEIIKIADLLSSQGSMAFIEATTDEKIALFEKENEVFLPVMFKEWLLFSDGGEFFLPAGVQLYGVEHKPLIDINNDDRPDDKYIVIGSLASGDPILCEKDSERISIYNQEAGRIEEDEVYDDFLAFIKDMYNFLGIGG